MVFALLGAAMGCGEALDTPRVELPVYADASGLRAVTTDLGYRIEGVHARLVIEDVAFTMAGEVHSSLWEPWKEVVLPTAYAHPGHLQDGDVTGILLGRHLLTWPVPTPTSFGSATLLVGAYESANFTFGTAAPELGIAADDPLLTHTAWIRGTAVREAAVIAFEAAIDAPPGRELVGVPFTVDVTEGTPAQLGVRLLPQDPYESDTLFDGIDFVALDVDRDGLVQLGPTNTEPAAQDAYFLLRRSLLTHDHYDILGF